MPVAGQCAIQAIAKPINEQTHNRQPQEGGIRVAQQKADQDQERAKNADAGEGVGHDPGRHVGGKPLQGRALDGAEQDVVFSCVRLEIADDGSLG